MKVRFGVGLGADTGPDELAAIVDHLEATGVDSLWFSELVYSKAVDPFIGMAHALARTTNLKVGTSVAVLPGRHPVLVAKQLASLAGLAPKRVLPVFGLRSAIPAERDIFVVPEGERAAVFDESLRLLRSVLEQDDVSFAGDYFSVSSVAVAPRPVKPLDHLARRVGARRVPPDRQAGRRLAGQLPHPGRSPAAAASRSSRRRTRPAARSKRTISASISPSATANCRTDWPLRYGAVGQTSIPAQLISAGWSHLHRQLDGYLEAGLTKFVIRPAGQPRTADFIDRFVAELLPRQN